MGKISYGMMMSLDGYISGLEGGPGLPMPEPALHGHFNAVQKRNVLELYGRGIYEIMGYWGTDDAMATPEGAEFAVAWRETPKVVFSTTLDRVEGPNTTLAKGDLETEVRALKARYDGDIGVGGAGLAASLSKLGLIDEYCLYMMPVVLGGGKPFFGTSTVPELKLLGSETLSQGALLVRYGKAA